MKIVELKDLKPGDTPGVDLKEVFNEEISSRSVFKMGTVVFTPGARVPAQGYGSHAGDEYSIVVSGRIRCESGGERAALTAGQASFIPAGEEHWAENHTDEDALIVWVMLEPGE